MKKSIFYGIIFLFASINVNALSFGFMTEADFIKLKPQPYTPDYTADVSTHLYFSQDLNIRNYLLTAKLGIVITNSKIKFQFVEFKNTILFNFAGITFGKYNVYWGKSIIKNDFFLNIPVTDVIDKNLWNIKADFVFDNLTVTAGSVLDTESIDDFAKPDWASCYTLFNFSCPAFTAGWEADCLFAAGKENEIKTAVEFLFTKISNVSVYADASLKVPPGTTISNNIDWSGVVGTSWYFDNKYVPATFIAEFCGYNNAAGFGLLVIPEIDTKFGYSLKMEYIQDNKMIVTNTVTMNAGTCKIYFEYQSANLLEKDKYNQLLSTGVKYEF
ncbi:MAG: hypothetical protein M0P01_09880 [Treponema sp.]|nr:hypothetical protein [Treponema sp.]